MRDLIKQVLKEEVQRKHLEELIEKYRYYSDLLDQYAEKIDNGIKLSDIELGLAQMKLVELKVLKKLNKDISEFVKKNDEVQKIIKSKGIVVYNTIIMGPKKDILNSILLNKTNAYKIGKPSDEWFDKNIQDIEKITSIFPLLKAKLKTTLEKCERKDFNGIIENVGETFVWSILNKVDTNYINWGNLISEKIINGVLSVDRSLPSELAEAQELIYEYFLLRGISKLNIDEGLKKILYDLKIRSLSYAELDLIEAFYTYVNNNDNRKIESMLSNIKSTSNQGDFVENNFVEYLNKYKNIVEDIYSFSSPGSLVDMKLGIDLMAKINDEYYAIQVKSSYEHANKAKIKYEPVNYLIIYPKNQFDPEEFNYITEKKSGDFNKFMTEISKESKSTPKPPPSTDYLGWAGYDK